MRNAIIFPSNLTLAGSEFHTNVKKVHRNCLGFLAGMSFEFQYAGYVDERA